jgi:DGQHR domain-containing protein
MNGRRREFVQVNALRIEQRTDAPLFVFGVNGRLIHRFAAVDQVRRDDDGVLQGYQRDRVKRHIADIANYLASTEAMLPNAIVVAFTELIPFEAVPGLIQTEWGTPGKIRIRLPAHRETKPAFIVDGQQRVTALAGLDPRRQFPVVVVGFQSPTERVSREQFVLVNRTKPLPRDLLNELLPHIDAQLPRQLTLRRISASVLELLRYDKQSPFYGRIRGSNGLLGANMSQASILGVIEGSIRRDGVLASHYGVDESGSDVGGMARIMSVFYSGVRRVWPYAWDGTPRTSRLVHGVGIGALGALMEVVMSEVDARAPRAESSVERRLRRIENRCAWTDGRWPRLGLRWDDLQNTSQDKRRLGTHLVAEYERRLRRS